MTHCDCSLDDLLTEPEKLFSKTGYLSRVSGRRALLKAYYRRQLQFRKVSSRTLVGPRNALRSLTV